jgi:ribosomal protein L29
MKTKDKTTMHNSSVAELTKVVKDSEAKLAEWGVNRYSKQSKNVREARALRNKIAVAKTVLRYKELQHE